MTLAFASFVVDIFVVDSFVDYSVDYFVDLRSGLVLHWSFPLAARLGARSALRALFFIASWEPVRP